MSSRIRGPGCGNYLQMMPDGRLSIVNVTVESAATLVPALGLLVDHVSGIKALCRVLDAGHEPDGSERAGGLGAGASLQVRDGHRAQGDGQVHG
jgi:hypothetical protein